MSQQDIFKKAIAAKLAGDEEGFKAAISEAIKSKAKAMLAEGPMGGQYTPPYIDQIESGWFRIPDLELPEGNAANVPAGTYEIGIGVEPDSDADSAFGNFNEVQLFDMDGNEVATLNDQAAYNFVETHVPQNAQEYMHDRAGEQYMQQAQQHNDDAMADRGADAKFARDSGMDGF